MIIYIVISIIISVFFAIGIKMLIKERRHKQKQFGIAEAYQRFMREFKLAIDYSEFLCYRYIGLNRKNRKLILIDHCAGQKQEDCICLQEIGESKIIYSKDEAQNTKNIWLELRNKRNNKSMRFCFYDRDFDPIMELPSLARKAIHWKTRLAIYKRSGNFSLEAEYVL
jgi:hypothetical protein